MKIVKLLVLFIISLMTSDTAWRTVENSNIMFIV